MEHVLTEVEKERHSVIKACIDGDITNAVAAGRLGLSVRQVRRLKRKVEDRGEKGAIHGNHGQTSHNATDKKTRNAVVTFLKRPLHHDFGPTFAQEKLAEENIVLSDETVRSIMTAENIWEPRRRRGSDIHREWRERKGMYGELVQFDGCYHIWLECRGGTTELCLLASIDDATSMVPHKVFEDNEGVHAVFRFWWTYFEIHGLPVAIYLDKFSTYKINHVNAVDNDDMMTQFQRAMKQLDIRVINAHSPEAKGRIERLFETLQDRLVKEMRLKHIHTRDAANKYLFEQYTDEHNARFSVQARERGDAHRPLTKKLREQLPSILSIQSKRKVNNDYTVRFKNDWYQLAATQKTTVYKRDEVTIETRLDGSVHIRLKGIYLAYTKLPARPERTKMKVTALTREKPRWTPPKDHPWRK